jgi:hypothetical protein
VKTIAVGDLGAISFRVAVLAGGFRKPVAENLLGRKPGFLDSGANRLGRLAVSTEIGRGKLRGRGQLSGAQAIDLAAKTGAVVQHAIDFRSSVEDRRASSGARFHCASDFELAQMAQDAPDLGPKLSPV